MQLPDYIKLHSFSLSREAEAHFRNILESCSTAEPGSLYAANRHFNLSTTETKICYALIRFLPVFQMRFALGEVEIARIKHVQIRTVYVQIRTKIRMEVRTLVRTNMYAKIRT